MNLRDLKYIIAVADQRHFGRAAEVCCVSQPTLSGQVKKLEEQLGVTLFERTRRSVTLTPIGAEIVAQARNVVEQADALLQLAKRHQNPYAGPLRVGAIPTLSPYLMPLILRPLKARYPQMRLVLFEEPTERLLARLKKHEIDAALLATAVDDPELVAEPLFDEPFWLAHPVSDPLYTQDEITREEIENMDLLLLADGHCLADQVMDVCGWEQRPRDSEMGALRAASLETLLQLVGAGFGSTLVPALATRGSWMTDSGIVARQLDFPDTWRRISMVYRKSFPRKQALGGLAAVILDNLPNTVTVVSMD